MSRTFDQEHFDKLQADIDELEEQLRSYRSRGESDSKAAKAFSLDADDVDFVRDSTVRQPEAFVTTRRTREKLPNNEDRVSNWGRETLNSTTAATPRSPSGQRNPLRDPFRTSGTLPRTSTSRRCSPSPRRPDTPHQRGESRSQSRDVEGTRHSTGHLVGAKLGSFNGNTCLETFLAKFENCAEYFSWKNKDRLFHLRASLEGAAGQILWDAGKTTTVEEIIRLLRARFGNENQAERFRAELRSRRRQKGESLQKLYQDICRLMSLAYPGPSSTLSDIVGRDAFLEALDDQPFRIRLLEKEPKTLDDVLNLACRLEAFDRVSVGDRPSREDDTSKFRSKTVRAATIAGCGGAVGEPTIPTEAIFHQLSELKELFEAHKRDV